MRLLVTGASGLLGLNMSLHAAQNHKVMGISRQKLASTPFEAVQADLLDAGAIPGILEAFRPEAVVHCAAVADLDYCEAHPELARRINADASEQIAIECRARNIRLVHISTDAVFDGEKEGSYSEVDEPRPRGVYATTKHAAETAVAGSNPHAVIARVNFYGWSLSGRRSLGEFFVNHLSQGAAVQGFTDVVFCPAFVVDLAEVLLKLLKSRLRGLYHVVGKEAMTKFDFGLAIARKFGYDASLVSPRSVEQSSLAARRSHNLRLATDKLSTDLGEPLPSFSTGLDKFYGQYLHGFPQQIRSYQQAADTVRGLQSGREQPT